MKKATAKIYPDVPEQYIRLLATNVCLRAIEDARDPDPLTALDACMWLLSSDFPLWVEAAGLPFADPWELLTSGRAMQARTRKGKRHE